MATVGVLYVLVNAGVQYVLPASAIAASPRPASDAVALVMGHMGASIVSAGMAISMLVTLNGTIMSGARVPFAVARDGYFFSALADVSSALSHALGRHRDAGSSVDCAFIAGRKFPATVFARDLRRVALLYDRGQHRVCFSLARSAGGAALSGLRLSRRSSVVRDRGSRASLLHLSRKLAELFLRTVGHSGWSASVPVVPIKKITDRIRLNI